MKYVNCLIVLLLLSACARPIEQPQLTQEDVVSTIVASTMQPLMEKPTITPIPTTPSSIEVDPGLLDVEITFPESLMDTSTVDLDAYFENGFKGAVVNADGSVTVKMSKVKHRELMNELGEVINESFNEMIGAQDTPYITSITSNKDFKSVTVNVERTGYESAFDMTPFIIGFQVMFYQTLAGIEPRCEVRILDASTGEILNTTLYPDDLQ